VRRALTALLVVGLMLGLPAAALAEQSGSAVDPDWLHVQLWGDWCNFDAATAEGHSAPQTYSASTTTEWSVDDSGAILQEVTQEGFMTTDGVTRPFHSTLTTSGPASAYLQQAPLEEGDDFLAPRFFDESLTVDYEWAVTGFYRFEYHNVAGDGAAEVYGPTFCSEPQGRGAVRDR
jgi:hypothetical protein